MTYKTFWLNGKRHQLNWAGPGVYMAVDNGRSVALWPAHWQYILRRKVPFFYLGKAKNARAIYWFRTGPGAYLTKARAARLLPAVASQAVA